MSLTVEELKARLEEAFAGKLSKLTVATGQVTAEVTPEHLLDVCGVLRDDARFRFEQLMDLCGVDYAEYGESEWLTNDASTSGFSRGVSPDAGSPPRWQGQRYAVVYHLLSLTHNQRLRLRVFVDGEPPTLPTVTEIWNSANWYEREAFDLFGVLFDGHPDLRRLLTDYGFIGHPFRKDFPLEGHVEVRYDPDKGRVVYQPVTIQNRVLVPRVIRRDNELPGAHKEGGGGA